MSLPILPPEIWNIIFNFKEKLEIQLNKKYIICKTINGEYKEQVATIDCRYKNKTKYIYEYSYGILGYHEGYCTRNQIRELTDEEKTHIQENRYFNLPQQFYHSIPNFD